jgi:hypothetical protein
MSRKNTNNRLAALRGTIDSQPLNPAAVDLSYAEFLGDGQLPENARIAWTVLNRALNARKPPVDPRAGSDSIFRRRAGDIDRPGFVALPPREQVFREAVSALDPASRFARLLIGLLIQAGDDPTDPEFIPSDCQIPQFGSTAMSLFGWPDQWVRPPYEQQLQRVLQQHAALRADTDRSDAWFRAAAAGLAGFLSRGEVPSDDLVCRFALTIGEMFAIHAHYFGHGDEELLAAFEASATTSGAERDAVLVVLGALQVRATEALR